MQPSTTHSAHEPEDSHPAQRSSKDPFAPWASSRHAGVLKGTHRVTGQVKWRVRYRPTPNSPQTSRTFDKLEDAVRFRNDMQNRAQQRKHGLDSPAPNRTDTFERWATDKYIAIRTNGETVAAYTRSIERLRRCDPEFLSLPLGLIRKVDLERAQARLVKAGYAGRTVNATMALVMGVLHSAAENGHIAPFALRLPKRPVSPKKPTPTQGDLLAMIEATEPWYRSLLACTAILGLRSGEVRGLTIERMDGIAHSLREGWVYTSDPFAWEARIHRQLMHDGRTMGPVKGSRHREVYPDEAALQVIVRHLNRFGPGPDTGEGRLIFQRFTNDGAPLSGMESDYFVKLVGRASARGLGRHYTPHSLRRLHVTLRLSAGEQVFQVSEDVGHADPVLTQQVYNDLVRRQRLRGDAFAAVASAADAAEMPQVGAVTPLTR